MASSSVLKVMTLAVNGQDVNITDYNALPSGPGAFLFFIQEHFKRVLNRPLPSNGLDGLMFNVFTANVIGRVITPATDCMKFPDGLGIEYGSALLIRELPLVVVPVQVVPPVLAPVKTFPATGLELRV